MPIYEYLCSQGHRYERWESFSAPAEQECPHCGGQARRLFSPPAIIFKGPGFYSTDNRRDGGRAEERGQEKEEAKTEE
ncbi:MAG: FmdB family zinc ribbon protein [Dehalococcoidia bacterium]|nr:FmdB family zinc ribbon protein [Dehalococcoidia bacterium]